MTQLVRAALLLVGLAALGGLCARFGLSDLAAAIERVNLDSLGLYAGAALAVRLGYSLRWWSVLQAMGRPPRLWRLAAARLAGDAVGALLPGGRVGGDPVRVALTVGNGRGGVSASSAVAIDRVMELISNSVCAILYVSIFSLTRVDTTRAPLGLLLVALVAPLLMLIATVAVLRAAWRPFTPLLARLVRVVPRLRRGLEVVRRTEDQLIAFLRDAPIRFVMGVLGSLLVEVTIIVEYHFLLAAFGIALDLPTLLMVLVASGLTRVAPTPGGVGALEGGEVAVLSLASGRPEVGFLVGMVLRLHETLWTGLGVLVLVTQGMSIARLRLLATHKAVA